MSQEQTNFYEFGRFRIDTVKRLLLRDQVPVPIAPKVLETLLTFVRNPGRVLEKDELVKAVWSDNFVEDASLANSISALRKILGERPNEHCFIVTVPGRGYRFVAELRVQPAESTGVSIEQQECDIHAESRRDVHASVASTVAISSDTSKLPRTLTIAGSLLILAAGGVWWQTLSQNHPLPGLSIAVLPFGGISGDLESRRFGDGLTEQLTHALAVEPGFTVNTTEFQVQGDDSDARTLTRKLNATTALKGAVQRVDSQTSVTAKMIGLPSGQTLWSETYELGSDHVLDSQVSVAAVIVRTLRSRFGGLSTHQLSEPPTRSSPALKWYLKAREEWLTQRQPALLKSVEYYHDAISEDDKYADAYAGLAASELFLANIESTPADRVTNAKSAAQKALGFNDRLTDAHAVLGNIYLRREWNFPAAEQELKRALELNPGHSPYEYWYALAAALRGHVADALAEMDIGRMVNPKSETICMATGMVYLVMRQFGIAEMWARKALELAPDDALSRQLLGLTLEQQRRLPAAIAVFRVCAAASRESSQCIADLGHALALSGNVGEASTFLHKLAVKPKPDSLSIALIWLGLRDKSKALDSLDQAYRNHEPKLPWIRVDPRFASLVSEPRFAALLERIGLPL